MNKQLDYWTGRFGDDYHSRNVLTEDIIKQREVFWMTILNTFGDDIPKSILEIGAGNGLNIQALDNIYKKYGYKCLLECVEPNEKARVSLTEQNIVESVFPDMGGILQKYDLVFTSGVLIHIHPDNLLEFTKNIFKLSNKYIVCAEYFRPEPEVKPYRGEKEALFIRDFGSYWLDNHPLQCVSFGFAWKRMMGIDNIVWQVFKKVN